MERNPWTKCVRTTWYRNEIEHACRKHGRKGMLVLLEVGCHTQRENIILVPFLFLSWESFKRQSVQEVHELLRFTTYRRVFSFIVLSKGSIIKKLVVMVPEIIDRNDRNLFLCKNNFFYSCQDGWWWNSRPPNHIWVCCLSSFSSFSDSLSFTYLGAERKFFTTVTWVHTGICLLWSFMQRLLGRILTKKLKVLHPKRQYKHFHLSFVTWKVLGFSDMRLYVEPTDAIKCCRA